MVQVRNCSLPSRSVDIPPPPRPPNSLHCAAPGTWNTWDAHYSTENRLPARPSGKREQGVSSASFPSHPKPLSLEMQPQGQWLALLSRCVLDWRTEASPCCGTFLSCLEVLAGGEAERRCSSAVLMICTSTFSIGGSGVVCISGA